MTIRPYVLAVWPRRLQDSELFVVAVDDGVQQQPSVEDGGVVERKSVAK